MFWSFITAVGITRLRLDLLWPIAVEIPKFRFFSVTVATKLPYLLQKGSKVLVTKDRCRSNSSGQCLLPRVTLEFIRILLSFLEFIRILQDIPSLASAAFCQIEVTVRLKSPKPWCCWTVANWRQFVTYVRHSAAQIMAVLLIIVCVYRVNVADFRYLTRGTVKSTCSWHSST